MGPERVAFTTSIPVEVVYGAGYLPADLNNLFITHPRPMELIGRAEEAGFPSNLCSWIKGIFGVLAADPDLRIIVAVTQGDCSNTHALMEVLKLRGKEVIPFEYPYDRDRAKLTAQIEALMRQLGTDWDRVMEAKRRLDAIRRKLAILDEMTWKENKVSGGENHLFLVSSSDFDSDPEIFERRLDEFLASAGSRLPYRDEVRLGYAGVPPIFKDFYEFVEGLGARVVFNEVQRQFSMPYMADDLVEQYLLYTYPYDIFARIRDINAAIEQREIQGVVHYTQSFCFRQIQDIILREKLKVPVLTLEGEDPLPLDHRLKTRIEAFVDMLR